MRNYSRMLFDSPSEMALNISPHLDVIQFGGAFFPRQGWPPVATSTAIALDNYGRDQEQRNVAASSRNDDESNGYKCLLIFAGFMAMFL
jgi:hypothetical protein